MQINHPRFGGDIVFAHYATGETAILIERAGERIAVATVNIEDWGAPRAGLDEVWIKTWSENAGMDRELVSAGVITLTGKRETGGYENRCVAVLGKLTPAALAERAAQQGL